MEKKRRERESEPGAWEGRGWPGGPRGLMGLSLHSQQGNS